MGEVVRLCQPAGTTAPQLQSVAVRDMDPVLPDFQFLSENGNLESDTHIFPFKCCQSIKRLLHMNRPKKMSVVQAWAPGATRF